MRIYYGYMNDNSYNTLKQIIHKCVHESCCRHARNKMMYETLWSIMITIVDDWKVLGR